MEAVRFDELQLDERIVRAVTDMGFEAASPIQAQAIPVQLEGLDIIGQAQTGTGKTAAFGIPLLQKIDPDSKKLQAIALCPTESWRFRWLRRSADWRNICTESRFFQSTEDRTS